MCPGCLITHEHMDHCRAVESLTALGVECYGSHGTRKAVPGLHATRLPISLDPFVCRCFPVCHDALDPCGWLILNRETGERMVYATDCCGLYNTFPGVHYWLIECNYMDELLSSGTPPVLARRLTASHMSLARLLEVFAANDLTDCPEDRAVPRQPGTAGPPKSRAAGCQGHGKSHGGSRGG